MSNTQIEKIDGGEVKNKNWEDNLKVGDKVVFGKYSGTEVKLDGVEYLVMREDDIMGVIEK
jgi:co-chaperonin GroES (HSP10)